MMAYLALKFPHVIGAVILFGTGPASPASC